MPPRVPELPSRRVEDDLRRRCRAGEWEPGERLPAVAELARLYEQARYAPASPLSQASLETARHHLILLAGVSQP